MPKRARKNAEFGLWVKQGRSASGKTQKELADEAAISQQGWSRLEQGFVPTKEELAKICLALGRSKQEAEAILAATNKLDERARILEEEFENFRKWLIKRPQPTHLFVIREDPEPINEMSLDLHCGILQEPIDLHMSILFRHSDPKIWETFRRFLGAIENKWRTINKDNSLSDKPRERIAGYYRHPDAEEDSKVSIPMAQPVILVIDGNGSAELFCYGSHDDVYESYKRAGNDEDQALFKSMMLLRAPKVKAELFASWVGSNIWLGLAPSSWKPIPWPTQTDQ